MDALRALFLRLGDDKPHAGSDAVLWLELLQGGAISVGTWHFDLPVEGDVWPWMLGGPDADIVRLAWAWRAMRLQKIAESEDGRCLLLDMEPCEEHSHRVYMTERGSYKLQRCFNDVESMARWILGQDDEEDPMEDIQALNPDDWSRDPRSAEHGLVLMESLHPSRIYEAYRENQTPSAPAGVPHMAPDGFARQRVALLHTLMAFVKRREVRLPAGFTEDECSDVHRDLCARLRALSRAMAADEVPPLVSEMALSEHRDMAALAVSFIEAFTRNRSRTPHLSASVAQTNAFLMKCIHGGIRKLRQASVLDVEREDEWSLADELLEVGLHSLANERAARADHEPLVAALAEALVDSPHVNDVYADDGELRRVFTEALE